METLLKIENLHVSKPHLCFSPCGACLNQVGIIEYAVTEKDGIANWIGCVIVWEISLAAK